MLRLQGGMPDSVLLEESLDHCRRTARIAARNFYYGFRLLPSKKRDALCVLYTFMRGVDDISDEPGNLADKTNGLAACRARMDQALAGDVAGDRVWPAFRHIISSFGIPPRYLHDLISGAEMDLTVARYASFEDLREYCYRVAGTVGICCAYVFGFTDPHTPQTAEALGIAFQLTNILRDIAKDYQMGRIYLPAEDLANFGCGPEDLAAQHASASLVRLIAFEAERAWQFYDEGWQTAFLINEDSRPALWALAQIYSGILEKIEARNYDAIAAPPARLSTAEKLWILARARIGWRGRNNVLRKRNGDRRRIGGPVVRHRAG